jgi:hypothetical protein
MRRPLQSDWEAEGKVSGMPGWVFRGRRMIRGMGHMLFPRYIQREARDFFYLTARAVLPGAPVPRAATPATPATAATAGAEGGPGEGAWRTKGLPQHGFPFAIATTWVRYPGHPEKKLRVVRADPRTMKPGAGSGGESPTVLSVESGGKGPASLWWSNGAFAIAPSAPRADATLLAGGFPTAPSAAAGAPAARAVVGVQDEDGMLVWVELPPDERADAGAAAAMDSLLERLGCSTRLALVGGARAFLGGTLDAAGEAGAPAPPSATRMVRVTGPGAHPMFADTPLVPVQVWRPLQAKRVRYFYKPDAGARSQAGPPDAGAQDSDPQSSHIEAPRGSLQPADTARSGEASAATSASPTPNISTSRAR